MVACRSFSVVSLLAGLIRTGMTLRPPILSWLETTHGVQINRVQINSTSPNERGLVASRDLSSEELVARIPLEATLQVKGNLANDEDAWAGALAAKLWMESKDPSSPFQTYLQEGLPQDPPTILCRWSTAEREFLQNVTLIQEISNNDEWRERQFRRFGEDCRRDEFLYRLDLVCSRTLYQSSTQSRYLVPLIDLANHAPREANGGHFTFDDENVYLFAGSRGVKEGQPIYLDYGDRTVDDFLMHYGFCPDRCQSDAILLPNGKQISWTKPCTDDEVTSVVDQCLKLLDSYPTTLEEDLHEFRRKHGSLTASPAINMALQYRIAKKLLLKSAAGFSPYYQ